MTTAATSQVSNIGQKPAAISGRELSELLHPMTPEAFTSQYWGNRPIFIKGSPEKLARLFPGGIKRADVFQTARESTLKQAKGFRIGAMKRDWLEPAMATGQQPYVFIQPEEMEAMAAEGATVVVDSFGDARLAAFIAALKAQLRHPGEVRVDAFLSPAGDGFPPHIDRASVIVIQLAGRKLWKISAAPVLPWPNGTTAFAPDGTVGHRDYEPEWWEEMERVDLENLTEIMLEPGDVLCLPAGTIHGTEAMGEASLSASLLFGPCRSLDLISRILANRLNSDPAWRNVPAPHSSNSQPGELPYDVKQFLAARLEELRAALEALTPEDLDLNREWHRLLADPGETARANLSLTAGTTGQLPIQPGEVLSLSRRAPITYALGIDADGDRCITAFYGDKEISVGGEWTPFLQTLIAQGKFTAESATQWSDSGESYPWETVKEYLQALLDQGLIERAAA